MHNLGEFSASSSSHSQRSGQTVGKAASFRPAAAARQGNGKLQKGLPSDVVGYICTYSAMGRCLTCMKLFPHQCPTLIIFDEIHHLDDEDEDTGISLNRGKTAKRAFDGGVIIDCRFLERRFDQQWIEFRLWSLRREMDQTPNWRPFQISLLPLRRGGRRQNLPARGLSGRRRAGDVGSRGYAWRGPASSFC